jgi:hypothetical protein
MGPQHIGLYYDLNRALLPEAFQPFHQVRIWLGPTCAAQHGEEGKSVGRSSQQQQQGVQKACRRCQACVTTGLASSDTSQQDKHHHTYIHPPPCTIPPSATHTGLLFPPALQAAAQGRLQGPAGRARPHTQQQPHVEEGHPGAAVMPQQRGCASGASAGGSGVRQEHSSGADGGVGTQQGLVSVRLFCVGCGVLDWGCVWMPMQAGLVAAAAASTCFLHGRH